MKVEVTNFAYSEAEDAVARVRISYSFWERLIGKRTHARLYRGKLGSWDLWVPDNMRSFLLYPKLSTSSNAIIERALDRTFHQRTKHAT